MIWSFSRDNLNRKFPAHPPSQSIAPRRFRIEGERARDMRLTATFAIDNSESLAAFLEKYSDLSVEARGEDFVIEQR